MNSANNKCKWTNSTWNGSISDYVFDTSRFVNTNECNNYSPPFLTYIPSGIPKMNIDIENDLKGMSQPITKCTHCKYQPEDIKLSQASYVNMIASKLYDKYPSNKRECNK